MADPHPKLLLVCDPAEQDGMMTMLASGGYWLVTLADGGDATLAMFRRVKPEVVILSATLERGDARALASAIRTSEVAPSAQIILIGDAEGPVRNALDAGSFEVDSFVARPVAAKALLFAVQTAVKAARTPRPRSVPPAAAAPATAAGDAGTGAKAAAGDAGAGVKAAAGDAGAGVKAPASAAETDTADLEVKVQSAVNQAIDDFVRDAMEALTQEDGEERRDAGAGDGGGGSGMQAPVIESGGFLDDEALPAGSEATGTSASGPAQGESRGYGSRVEELLAAVAPEPPPELSLPPLETDRAARAARVLDIDALGDEGELPDEDSELSGEEGELSGEEGELSWQELMPSARAQTVPPVLEVKRAESVPPVLDVKRAESAPPVPEVKRAESVPAVPEVKRAESVPAVPEVDAQPGGSGYARELRRKMSAMAERLFPGQNESKAIELDLPVDHAADIDLTVIGMDDAREPGLGMSGNPAFVPLLAAQPAALAEAPQARIGESAAPKSLSDVVLSETQRAGQVNAAPRQPALAFGEVEGAPPLPRAESEQAELFQEGEVRRGEADAAILIERMYRRRFTGRVELHREDEGKEILFERGRPVFASSTVTRDRMGELLFREGKITREQLTRVERMVAESGRRMGEVLIEMGWLKRRELLPVVRRHIEDIVYSLFAWDSGHYRVVAGDFATAERIRISRHPAAMILEGVRRKFDIDTLRALLGGPESVIEIADERQLKSVVSVADLTSAERKVIAAFDGERSLAEVHAASGAELMEVYQLAYGLIVWGAAQALRRGDERGAFAERETLIGETDLAIDRQRVMAKYSLVCEADYFTLLGVRRDATSFEIKRAYETARRDYAVEVFPAPLRTELSREISEINELLSEAYEVLRDDGLRASYLANLRS